VSRLRPRSDAGQATVEVALTLPVVVVVLLAVVQVALVARDDLVVLHAAREGARAAALAPGGSDPTGAAEVAARHGAGHLAPTRLRVEVAVGARLVTVTVHYRAPTDVPAVGALVGDVDLEASVTMQREP